MNYFNYHTHTHFCDGSSAPEEYILSAIQKNMHSLGFSGHAAVPFENSWSIKPDRINDYFSTVRELKLKYADRLNVLISLEIDHIPGVTEGIEKLRKQYNLDYAIGSVHLVTDRVSDKLWFIDGPEKNYITGLETIFNNNIQNAVGAYYKQIQEMVAVHKPDIIGHFDKVKMNNKDRYFSTEENWYKKLVTETVKVIADSDSIVEVNTRGIYKKRSTELFPDTTILEQCYQLGIPVTISSDAHAPDELTNYFEETILLLKDIGFKGVQVFKNKKWELQPFSN